MKAERDFKVVLPGDVYPRLVRAGDDIPDGCEVVALHMGALSKKDATAVEKRLAGREGASAKADTGKRNKAAAEAKAMSGAPENK